ncbi:MAG: large conductance mechanosensitive channel protein MscL [Coriobacteriales bacterium]|nr:large conductance mechanosensitive channel protein MscL [Coriobacteriales bacterium]
MMGMVQEFKEFINRGNVMDLAVGVIIGGAFTGIVTSLTDDIINPLIAVVTGGSSTEIGGLVVPGTNIDFGKFLGAIINFLIVAAVVFAIVKAMNKLQAASDALLKKEQEEEEAAAPTCPFCLEEVKEGATRCPHCAGEFDSPAEAK